MAVPAGRRRLPSSAAASPRRRRLQEQQQLQQPLSNQRTRRTPPLLLPLLPLLLPLLVSCCCFTSYARPAIPSPLEVRFALRLGSHASRPPGRTHLGSHRYSRTHAGTGPPPPTRGPEPSRTSPCPTRLLRRRRPLGPCSRPVPPSRASLCRRPSFSRPTRGACVYWYGMAVQRRPGSRSAD